MIELFSEPCDLEESDRTRLIHQIMESKGVLVFNISGSQNSRGLSVLDLIDRYFNIAYRSNGRFECQDVSESLLDGPCMNAHPVIHLDLNDVYVGDKGLFLKGIRTRISNTCVEHRELLEENYIFVPELGIDIHIGIWESWNEELQEFETDFDFYCFRDSVTKETIYTEQGSSLITCIHNYTGLLWEKIIDLNCDYNS